jgi:BirA family biotin operon repressor/biotin-[acetyl-CoA-carboxylase] ligase
MSKPIWGSKVIHLPQVNSTNQFARELSSYIQPIFEGTTVIAEDQLGGKGRKDKEWVSEKNKNLCFSVILFPKFLTASNFFYLSKAVALGICDYLNKLNIIHARIKWPNDVYVGQDKIAGILIENSWKGSEIQETVVGIGFNVNQIHFPAHLPNPTSVQLIKNRVYDLDKVLPDLLKTLDERYKQLAEGAFDKIDTDYRYMLYGLGEYHTYLTDAGKLMAKIVGVETSGMLKVQNEAGEELLFDLDQIKLQNGSQQV